MSNYRKIKVAITGNIGSGKSTFAKFISELGIPVITADIVSKQILETDAEVRLDVIRNFGAQAFQGKKINNKYIADVIFSDPKKLNKINSILHPRVRKKIDLLSKEFFNTNDLVFVETALIYESKIENMFDYVVLITAEKLARLDRTSKSKKISENDFLKRENMQINENLKKKKADFIFINDGSKDELKQKAILLIKLLKPNEK